MFIPRKNQAEILKYEKGRMGISAVPGSGKTHTLSYLASRLILMGGLESDQEILIVTLVNSAVDNFTTRIGGFIRAAGLLENIGYRVRTLHGLAHDIIMERPDLAGLSTQFSIVDDVESVRMVDQISAAYIRLHPELVNFLLRPDIELSQVNRGPNNFPDMVSKLNQAFIQLAKDLQAEPESIIKMMSKHQYSDLLMEMGVEVYQQYQRGLRYRNALDFSDLIRLAYQVLESDTTYLDRLRYRWPYILEDEAQDSSGIQEKMLSLLVGENGNWVRVGDPNQAIYETFTTANPKYLRTFLKQDGVLSMSLPHSGRSNLSIIRLANNLITWAKASHPIPLIRSSLDEPLIEPSPPGDPQPNPPDQPNAIYIRKSKCKPDEEIRLVVDSLKRWLPEHQDNTVAVLCPIGWYGEKVAEALHQANIPMVELLKSSQSTRRVAAILEKVLLAINEPGNSKVIAAAFNQILKKDEFSEDDNSFLTKLTSAFQKIGRMEDFFYPGPGKEWQTAIEPAGIPQSLYNSINDLRVSFSRWHLVSVLPIDQLILSISQDIFSTPAELALAHKFALLLEFSAKLHPDYSLADFASELAEISRNVRKFNGFSDEELRFNPDDHKGKVFVSTYHKAKGLEWDRVYLMSVNNYDFPSAQEFDTYVGEKWFIRENYNPQAEALDRLKGIIQEDTNLIQAQEGSATLQARLDYASERLRLLFVGITRARESLVITWNTGRGKEERRMALPLEALYSIWTGQDDTSN